jgi:hypothetical protein
MVVWWHPPFVQHTMGTFEELLGERDRIVSSCCFVPIEFCVETATVKTETRGTGLGLWRENLTDAEMLPPLLSLYGPGTAPSAGRWNVSFLAQRSRVRFPLPPPPRR